MMSDDADKKAAVDAKKRDVVVPFGASFAEEKKKIETVQDVAKKGICLSAYKYKSYQYQTKPQRLGCNIFCKVIHNTKF